MHDSLADIAKAQNSLRYSVMSTFPDGLSKFTKLSQISASAAHFAPAAKR